MTINKSVRGILLALWLTGLMIAPGESLRQSFAGLAIFIFASFGLGFVTDKNENKTK